MDAALRKFGDDYGLATFTAGQARECGQGLVRWPTEDEPWHAMVFTLEGRRRTRRQQKLLAATAILCRQPQPR